MDELCLRRGANLTRTRCARPECEAPSHRCRPRRRAIPSNCDGIDQPDSQHTCPDIEHGSPGDREAVALPPAVVVEEISLAGAIVDRVAHRRTTVVEAVQKSSGAGWIISNDEIVAAREVVKKTLNLSISPTSALSIAALTQALKNHHTFNGAVACIITGD